MAHPLTHQRSIVVPKLGRRAGIALAGVVSAAAACGNAGLPASDGGGGPATYHDFAVAYASLRCGALFRCCSPGVAQGASGAADVASCTDQLAGQFDDARAESALSAGTAVYDAQAAASCLAAATAGYAACSAPADIGFLAPCLAGVLTGVAPAGQPCDHGLCSAGNVCAFASTGPFDGGSLTRCDPYARSGQRCGSTWSCELGLACVHDSCAPFLAAGAACASDDQCMSYRCAAGACAPRTLSMMLCQ